MVDMQVDHGMRFELRLRSAEATSAHYDVTLQQPDGVRDGSASIGVDGVQLEFAGAPLPEWCLQQLRATLRMVQRDAAKSGNYPRRLARWRPAPDAGSQGNEA